jgi:DNA invertase Pin-like site-specific DNA recombinase
MASFSPGAKAFSYLRVSSTGQTRGDGLRRQVERSRKYAADHGLELDESSEFEDRGRSAFKGAHVSEGGAFGAFLSRVEGGDIPRGSVLLVESLDRLSRQNVHIALGQLQSVIENGIVVVTLNDEREFYNLADIGQLMPSIMSMFLAHEESRKKQDRLSKAWSQKRKNAATVKMTRVCPEWLQLTADRRSFTPVPDRVAVVRRIYEMSDAGLGVYRIVRILNQEKIAAFRTQRWAHSTVKKILGNQAVRGQLHLHRMVDGKRTPTGEIIEDYYPRIVDDALFYRVANGLAARRTNGGGRTGYKQANLFKGKLHCAKCGGKITRLNRGPPPKGGTYLACSLGYRQGVGCTGKNWRYSDFEMAVLRLGRLSIAAQLQISDDAIKALRDKIDVLVGRIGECSKRIEYLDAVAAKTALSDETIQQRADAEDSRKKLKSDLQQAELDYQAAQHATLTDAEVEETLAALCDMERPTTEAHRAKAARLIGEVVERIDIDLEGLASFFTDDWIERIDRDHHDVADATTIPLIEDDELEALIAPSDPASAAPSFAVTYFGGSGDLIQTYPNEPDALRLRIPLRPSDWRKINLTLYRASISSHGRMQVLAPDAVVNLRASPKPLPKLRLGGE